MALPPVLGESPVILTSQGTTFAKLLNSAVKYFPDRQITPSWRRRYSFTGLEALLEVQERGQPAVVTFCHFGPYNLLRGCLHAAGIQTVPMLGSSLRSPDYMRRLQDQARLFPELPAAFYPHQIREVIAFLSAGKTLLIALDGDAGHTVEIPVDDRTTFRIATGPLRLAVRTGARLFPCVITDEGFWKFRVHIGRPVPEEFLTQKPDVVEAGTHLLSELLPRFRARPAQGAVTFFDRFQSIPRTTAPIQDELPQSRSHDASSATPRPWNS